MATMLLSVICFSFVIDSPKPPAVPIHFDDDRTGTSIFFNECTNEDVDITYRSRYSIRGMMNGQKIMLKVHFIEQQEGVGRVSGKRYIGHINQAETHNGSLVNSSYVYTKNLNVRMNAHGGSGNFKSSINLRYVINSSGDLTSAREDQGSECQ